MKINAEQKRKIQETLIKFNPPVFLEGNTIPKYAFAYVTRKTLSTLNESTKENDFKVVNQGKSKKYKGTIYKLEEIDGFFFMVRDIDGDEAIVKIEKEDLPDKEKLSASDVVSLGERLDDERRFGL
jgi:hypothetical protein